MEVLAVLDAYPPTRPFDVETDGATRLDDLIRQGAGQFAADESGWDGASIAAIVRNNLRIVATHQFGSVEGDLVLVVAGDDDPDTAGWRPYVSGEIAEIRLPCTHAELARPDMSRLVWGAVSERLIAHMGTTSER